ncbi:MAG: folylpolyglutamate synthase/dihydrofolate synthase family protein [Pirellulaceae bacterium]
MNQSNSQSPNKSPSEPPSCLLDDARYSKAIGFLCDRINYEKLASGTARYPFRIHRTGALLKKLGLSGYLADQVSRPLVPIVHIAGTKGKGSTSTMVASILTAAGFRTGLYTSPHLIDLEERFRIDGNPCSRLELAELTERIAPVAKELADEDQGVPSFFELTTAAALLHFHTQKCDAIVLEVGLGGRLDSTNVCMSSVTAITSIGLDHQHVLGNTLAEIAGEKAGIIKSGVPVVSGVRSVGGDTVPISRDAAAVIATKATEANAPLIQLGRDFDFKSVPDADWGSRLDFQTLKECPSPTTSDATRLGDVELKLDGDHQAHNASLAIQIVAQLRSDRDGSPLLKISDQAIRSGLKNVKCPGRIERFRLPGDVTVIVDAAHNDDSVNALCRCLDQRKGDRSLAIVFGTSQDKSAESMLQRLAPRADLLVLTQYAGNPRFRPTKDLLPMVPQAAIRKTIVGATPIEACRSGLEFVRESMGGDSTFVGGTMVVCGSFFLAAETRSWIESQSIG